MTEEYEFQEIQAKREDQLSGGGAYSAIKKEKPRPVGFVKSPGLPGAEKNNEEGGD